MKIRNLLLSGIAAFGLSIPTFTNIALAQVSMMASQDAGFILNFDGKQPIPTLSEIEITGVNTANEPRTLTVRVDDKPGASYADRANEERILPPGPFTLRFRLGLLQTPRGRAIIPGNVIKAYAQGRNINVSEIRLKRAAELPSDAMGWYFGPNEGAPLVGFNQVLAGDPRLEGNISRTQVRRPGTDPVLTYGVWTTAFTTQVPNGHYHIGMWVEDPGEWETLPPIYERRIRVNNKDLLMIRRSPASWDHQRYLLGRNTEADPAQSPYQTLGSRRGGKIEGSIFVTDGKLRVEFAGYPAGALFVSAITLEPDSPGATSVAVDAVERARAVAFHSAWPVVDEPKIDTTPVESLSVKTVGPQSVTVARGSFAELHFEVKTPVPAGGKLEVEWEGDEKLEDRAYWNMWRWQRVGAGAHGLILGSNHMRADQDSVTLRPEVPRPLTVLVHVPNDARPVIHKGVLKITSDGADEDARATTTIPFSVKVLPVRLPESTQKVGAFLDFAPDLMGDASTQQDARKQSSCDMDTLKWLGMTTVAPALEVPNTPAGLKHFIEEYKEAASKFKGPLVAYVPLRRMTTMAVADAVAGVIADTDEAIKREGLPPITWSVADEPHGAENINNLIRALKQYAPEAQLAAHLNSPDDKKFVSQLNLVTINQGYGADLSDIAAVKSLGSHPWLYNMGRFRLNAGFYLWHSKAEGLLQWHARMPTADPYDPTDGREADVQFLWPNPVVCGPQDLDADVLKLAEGAEDLRWVTWLDQVASSGNPEAQTLIKTIKSRLGTTWDDANKLTDTDLAEMRTEIQNLSQHIQ